jgi:hypothetical protein
MERAGAVWVWMERARAVWVRGGTGVERGGRGGGGDWREGGRTGEHEEEKLRCWSFYPTFVIQSSNLPSAKFPKVQTLCPNPVKTHGWECAVGQPLSFRRRRGRPPPSPPPAVVPTYMRPPRERGGGRCGLRWRRARMARGRSPLTAQEPKLFEGLPVRHLPRGFQLLSCHGRPPETRARREPTFSLGRWWAPLDGTTVLWPTCYLNATER